MAQVIEYFDVLYTKHIKQKSKSWEDGFLEYHLKSSKVSVHMCSLFIAASVYEGS